MPSNGTSSANWTLRLTAMAVGLFVLYLMFDQGLIDTSSDNRWAFIVMLIQVPLFLCFIANFLPMSLFKDRPRAAKVVGRLKKYFPYFLVVIIQGTITLVQMLFIEPRLPDWDLTHMVYSIEQDTVTTLQAMMMHDGITWYFESVYIWGFMLMIQGSILLYVALDNEKVVRMLTVGLLLNILIALPFFFFFPVNEAWATNPDYGHYDSDISFATDTVGVFHGNARAERVLYTYNNIDNNIPSLHTSVSLTVAGTICVNKRKLMGPIAMFLAVSVVVSTVYLGIHWLVDIVGGAVLAASIVYLLYYLDFKLRFDQSRMKKNKSPLYWESITWKGGSLRSKKGTQGD